MTDTYLPADPTTQAEPDSRINDALKAIARSLGALDTTIDTISARLRPVLADDVRAQAVQSDAVGTVPSSESPLRRRLTAFAAGIADQTERVADLLDRLEV